MNLKEHNISLEEGNPQPLKRLIFKERGDPLSHKKIKLQYCEEGNISLEEGNPQLLMR